MGKRVMVAGLAYLALLAALCYTNVQTAQTVPSEAETRGRNLGPATTQRLLDWRHRVVSDADFREEWESLQVGSAITMAFYWSTLVAAGALAVILYTGRIRRDLQADGSASEPRSSGGL